MGGALGLLLMVVCLAACSETSPEEAAIAKLREDAVFDVAEDEALLELMRSSCDTLASKGALGFLAEATSSGLTGSQAGLLLGEALQLYCPDASEMSDPLFGDAGS
jgi:hypothetical protein